MTDSVNVRRPGEASVIRCLVVEDQLPAQHVIERYMRDLPELQLVGAAASARDALDILAVHPVDLMFLDLHLPRLDGFAFLRGLPDPPSVIVTTAHADRALEGFELDVVDYLLKPFSFDRFRRAVGRVRRGEAAPDRSTERATAGRTTRFIRVGGEYRQLVIDDVVYLAADGDFVNIVTRTEQHFVLSTLAGWVKALPGEAFVQTHKSYAVN